MDNRGRNLSLPPIAMSGGDRSQSREESLSRIDMFEDRLLQQEQTSRALVEKAMSIREEMEDSLNYAQHSWQDEKKARKLLQEHIKTITSVVNKLSREIEVLEDEIRNRQSQAEGQTRVVKNLEMHHVAGLTDMRARVARSDAAIERLARDLKTCFESVNELKNKQESATSKLNERLEQQDKTLNNILMQLEKNQTEQSVNMQRIKGESTESLSHLDAKTRAVFDEIRSNISSTRLWAESEIVKVSHDFQARLEKMDALLESRQDKQDQRVDACLQRIQNLLDDEQELKFSLKEQGLTMAQKKAIEKECDRLKREYKQGFNVVHESIASMKSLLDAKLSFLEEDLKKSINGVMRMVVLT